MSDFFKWQICSRWQQTFCLEIKAVGIVHAVEITVRQLKLTKQIIVVVVRKKAIRPQTPEVTLKPPAMQPTLQGHDLAPKVQTPLHARLARQLPVKTALNLHPTKLSLSHQLNVTQK